MTFLSKALRLPSASELAEYRSSGSCYYRVFRRTLFA